MNHSVRQWLKRASRHTLRKWEVIRGLHGFRSGCAITLALSGVELSEVMDHVGWAQRHTALYYLQLTKVLNPSGASARLAQVDLSSATSQWEDFNELKRFVSAFPVDACRKRQNEESK